MSTARAAAQDVSVERLTRDLREAAATMGPQEARYLVAQYYRMQENRKRSDMQSGRLAEAGSPGEVLGWLARQDRTLEAAIKNALDRFSKGHPHGPWLRSIVGIGPVIAAGLLAHLDVKRSNTVGKWWRFAGLDPSSKWTAGERRPWNADLKVLCWKIGESFVKTKGNVRSYYGPLYDGRFEYESRKNAAGEYAEQAAAKLLIVRKAKSSTAPAADGDEAEDALENARERWEAGMLTDSHLRQRAKRWAVKLFLAHYHEVAFRIEFGEAPPAPYPIAFLGHVDKIAPPEIPTDGGEWEDQEEA